MLRMQEELEVALDSGSEGEGPHPEWLKDKAVSVDNAANWRRNKTARPSQPDSEVQDLTGMIVFADVLHAAFWVL